MYCAGPAPAAHDRNRRNGRQTSQVTDEQFRTMCNVRDWLVSVSLEHDKLEPGADATAIAIAVHERQRRQLSALLGSVKDQIEAHAT